MWYLVIILIGIVCGISTSYIYLKQYDILKSEFKSFGSDKIGKILSKLFTLEYLVILISLLGLLAAIIVSMENNLIITVLLFAISFAISGHIFENTF